MPTMDSPKISGAAGARPQKLERSVTTKQATGFRSSGPTRIAAIKRTESLKSSRSEGGGASGNSSRLQSIKPDQSFSSGSTVAEMRASPPYHYGQGSLPHAFLRNVDHPKVRRTASVGLRGSERSAALRRTASLGSRASGGSAARGSPNLQFSKLDRSSLFGSDLAVAGIRGTCSPYHFREANLPRMFLNNSAMTVTVVERPCWLQGCTEGEEERCWRVGIDKSNLSNTRLLQQNLIDQALCTLMQSSNPESRESQGDAQASKELARALHAYLHNPILRQWRDRKNPVTILAFCIFYLLGTVCLLAIFLGTFLSLDVGAGVALAICIPLGGLGTYLTAIITQRCMPMILKKLQDYPQEQTIRLENNLRIALEKIRNPPGERDASPTRPPNEPTSLIDAEMVFSATSSSTEARLEIVDIETPCTSSMHLSHPVAFSEEVLVVNSNSPPQTDCVIVRFPESDVSEASKTAPALPKDHCSSVGTTHHLFGISSCPSAAQGVIGQEPCVTSSLPIARARSSSVTM